MKGVRMVRANLSLTEVHRDWMRAQVDGGHYASESEYVRELIRRDVDAYQTEREEVASTVRVWLEPYVSPNRLDEVANKLALRLTSRTAAKP